MFLSEYLMFLLKTLTIVKYSFDHSYIFIHKIKTEEKQR